MHKKSTCYQYRDTGMTANRHSSNFNTSIARWRSLDSSIHRGCSRFVANTREPQRRMDYVSDGFNVDLLKRVKSGSWNLTTHFSVKAKAVRRTGSEPVKRRFTCCTGETRSIAWRGRHATLASSAPFDRKCKTRARFRRFTVEIDVERTKPETNEQNVVRSRNLALRNILKRWKFRRYVSDN